MNRAVATALSLMCAALTLQAGFAPEGLAQVKESPEDKQQRIEKFQEYRLIFEPSPSPEPPSAYGLRQGPDAIYDVDFVKLLDDPSLTTYWLGERNRDWATWLGTGAVAVPVGTAFFVSNFRAEGPLALFANAQRSEGANISDWRTFALSAAGAAVAVYGAYNLTQWLLETLDVSHPNRLDADSIKPRVAEWNQRLQERLNLDDADLPAPPTPRPSVSPSGSPVPGGVEASPAAAFPTVPVGGAGSLPAGAPPEAMPLPLPVVSPGRQAPEPKPRPSVLALPGAQ